MLRRIAAALLAAMLLLSMTISPALADITFSDDGKGGVSIQVGDETVGSDMSATTKTIVGKFKVALQAIIGLCAMISFAAFAFQVSKLIIYSGNESARAAALKGIGYAFAAVSLFGGVETLITIFWNVGG